MKRSRRKKPEILADTDTLDARPWAADVATSYRLLEELHQEARLAALGPPSFYAMAATMVERMTPGSDQDELRLLAIARLSLSLCRAGRSVVVS